MRKSTDAGTVNDFLAVAVAAAVDVVDVAVVVVVAAVAAVVAVAFSSEYLIIL